MSDPSLAAKVGKRRRVTVGQWLAVLVLVLFLAPLLASNLWGYLQSRNYLTEAAFKNIRNVAALEAAETREFVRASENLVPSIVAGNEHLFETLRAARDATATTATVERSLRAHLRAKVNESVSAEEFQVISPEGILLASSREDTVAGTDSSDSPCFVRGRESTRIVGFDYGASLPLEGEDTSPEPVRDHHDDSHHDDSPEEGEPGEAHAQHASDEPNMLVAAPITDHDGALLGIFCASFRFDVHRSLLLAHKDRTSQATLYVLDDADRIVCGSFEDVHGAPYGERLGSLTSGVLAQRAAWEGRHRLVSGEEVLIAYAPVEDLGWAVVVEVPVSRALADLESLKRQAMIVSVALVAIMLLAIFLSWRTVVRPLRALFRTSERIAAGEAGATVPPAGPREILDLTTAFNKMSVALRDSQQTLEDRIAARTVELRESQEFSELLLDSIDQRVVVTDRNYRIVKTNSAALRMHGDDLVGAMCYEAFENRTEPCDGCPVRVTLDTGKQAMTERFQQTLGGREAMRVETYPVLGAGGGLESVIAISRVITAEKQLQAKMAYQEKMAAFGQLAAGVAHEIGNPLAAIDSQLRLAQNDRNRVDETLDVVRSEVGRMSRLLRELVDFSRRKRHGLRLASANQAVQDVIRLLEHDPRARAVTIRSALAEHLPGVRATEDHLVQVLLNLGLNAVDALRETGSLLFETGVDDGDVTIRVSDTGNGIDEQARDHLFEPFLTTKEFGKGTGLGLFVSKSIIDDMGGKLQLESSGPDGSVFVIRIPVASKHPNGRGT